MPVLTYLLRGIAANIVKKCLQVHFPTLNRIVKCTGTRISASRVHRQHHPMYPATDIRFFAGDRTMSVSKNKVYYVPGTSAHISRVPGTEKSRSGTFWHFKLGREMYQGWKNAKMMSQVQMPRHFQKRRVSRNTV